MKLCDPTPTVRAPSAPPIPANDAPPRAAPPAPWMSEQLFAGRVEIEIAHGPHIYRLRQTSLGKLILTK